LNQLDKIAQNYKPLDDFDSIITKYSTKIIAPLCRNKSIIECGCSSGMMTKELIVNAQKIDVIEGSKQFCQIISDKFGTKINNIINSNFEDYTPTEKYDTIVFAHVLHHIDNPTDMLNHLKTWLKPNGQILISVPNINSFHRQLGVQMGLLKDTNQESERNKFFLQKGRFTKESLTMLMNESGFEVLQSKNFFFKPFHHDLMNQLLNSGNLTQELLDGLNNMGELYQDLACHTFLQAKLKS